MDPKVACNGIHIHFYGTCKRILEIGSVLEVPWFSNDLPHRTPRIGPKFRYPNWQYQDSSFWIKNRSHKNLNRFPVPEIPTREIPTRKFRLETLLYQKNHIRQDLTKNGQLLTILLR